MKRIDPPSDINVSTDEKTQSEINLIISIQRSTWANEYKLLMSNKEVSHKSPLSFHNPFLDKNGIMRMTGRIQEAELSYDETHPILLPSNNSFVDLLIIDYHENLLHSNVPVVMNELSRKYWLLKFRSSVKKGLRHCYYCKRYKYKKSQMNRFASLPEDRISNKRFRAFETIGLDYLGPINSGEAREQKLCILIICCLKVRAVHLEVTSNLDYNEFL